MEELAKTLLGLKSFNDRLKCLSESLDSLVFKYPEIYHMLFKEIKRREFEFNNPNKIVEWLNNSNPNAYLKLHEALLLVNNRNILAKEQYIDNLKPILLHTIQYRTNIEVVTKICSLIEKSQHLKAIYE